MGHPGGDVMSVARRSILGPLCGATLAGMVLLPIPATAYPAGSQDAMLFSDAGLGIDLLSGAIASCTISPGCFRLLLSGGATLGDVAIITFTTFALGTVLDHLAADPVDFNYTTVASPVFGMPPSLSPSAPPSLVNLVDQETNAIGLANAMITAFNRAEGAFVSGAPSYETIQLNAFNMFQGQLTTDLSNIGMDYNSFTSDFGLLF